MSSEEEETDYVKMAEGLDDLREALRMMLAAIEAEGFTEEQAREIVTAFYRGLHRPPTEPDSA